VQKLIKFQANEYPGERGTILCFGLILIY